jgi:hypothetical protein
MEGDELTLMEWTDGVLSLARERLLELDRRVRRVLRERPLLSLLGAAAFGCLAGRIMSRR